MAGGTVGSGNALESIGGASTPSSKAPASHAPLGLRGALRWSLPPMHGVTKPLATPPGVMVRTSVSPPRLTSSVLRPGLPTA